MKRIVMGAMAFLLITGAAGAQDTTRGKQHHKQSIEQLNLTADQKAKLQALRAEQKEALAKLKSNGNADATKGQRKELHQKYQAQMKTILTPEQQKQLESMRSERRKPDSSRIHGQRNAVKELNLTAAQQEQMKTLNQSFKAKRETLQNNTALSDAQKKDGMKALAQQHRQEIKKVLTAEQEQKMEALRKEHRKGAGK